MALPTTKGIAHIFGLRGTGGSVFTVQSDDISNRPALDVEVKDETGRVITDRLDDLRIEITVEGILKTESTPAEIGGIFAYNGVNYIIKDIADRGTNQDFRKLTIRAVKYQEIA
jgi:hypothetical protein